MLNIGCHLSAAKGYMNMGKEARALTQILFNFSRVIHAEVKRKLLTNKT